MRTVLRLLLVAMLACASTLVPTAAQASGGPTVLIVTDGNGDGEVVRYAIERLEMEARRWGFTLIEGDASSLDQPLATVGAGGVDVVMLLNTGADVLDPGQREALQAFVEGGGGLVATNSAAASEPDWDWYRQLLGATALSAPVDDAKETVTFNSGSPITDGLDDELELTDLWYYFDPEPAEPESVILAQLDSGDPAAWRSDEYQAFYAVPGGAADTWTERDFLQLIRQGIWWAAGEDGEMVQNSDSAAPAWPYTWTFALFVLAVAGGGSIAVWRLDKAERIRTADAG
ncbi:ThuA domain-containing protein [Glycomyces buryatensis]|uniref:ThuA domain-containing protein n=1 Tax=Glycomyces buryatensis TaxID=2570927 RepID=UPI0014562903|nr:ThuA domain-containing protein [Glycomyces buryatensis]